jgi:hypothetical protein
VTGLGWGVRVAQAVNTPEIGRASRPRRVQLVVVVVVLGDDDDDDDDDGDIIILNNYLHQGVLGYLSERTEILIAKSFYV